MKIFRTKAVLLDKAPAALLMAYGGVKCFSRLASFDTESPEIGVLGSRGGFARGGRHRLFYSLLEWVVTWEITKLESVDRQIF